MYAAGRAQTGTLVDAGEYVGRCRDFPSELRAVHSAVKEIFDPVVIGLHCIWQICLGDFVHQAAMSYRIDMDIHGYSVCSFSHLPFILARVQHFCCLLLMSA